MEEGRSAVQSKPVDLTMSHWRDQGPLNCKVYVGDLGSGAAKHELERAFEHYGPIINIWVARNPPGFAYVEFQDPRDAQDSVRGLDGRKICGRRVRVELAKGRQSGNRSGGYRGGGMSRSRYGGGGRYGSPPKRNRNSRSRSRSQERRRHRSSRRSRSRSRDRRRRSRSEERRSRSPSRSHGHHRSRSSSREMRSRSSSRDRIDRSKSRSRSLSPTHAGSRSQERKGDDEKPNQVGEGSPPKEPSPARDGEDGPKNEECNHDQGAEVNENEVKDKAPSEKEVEPQEMSVEVPKDQVAE